MRITQREQLVVAKPQNQRTPKNEKKKKTHAERRPGDEAVQHRRSMLNVDHEQGGSAIADDVQQKNWKDKARKVREPTGQQSHGAAR